jgi:hypothetical protein
MKTKRSTKDDIVGIYVYVRKRGAGKLTASWRVKQASPARERFQPNSGQVSLAI